MPTIKELLADPDFQELAPGEQADVRRRFFQVHVSQDKDFLSLSPEDRADIARQVIGEETPTIRQAPAPESLLKSAGRVATQIATGAVGAAGGMLVGGPVGALAGGVAGNVAGREIFDVATGTRKTPEETRDLALSDATFGLVFPAGGAAIGQGARAGVKTALRGGEEGAARTARMVEDFASFGAEPTAGQASGSRILQTTEGLLSKFPGSAGQFAKKAQETIARMGERVGGMARTLTGGAEPDVAMAGRTIEGGVKGFVEGFKERAAKLYEAADKLIPGDTLIPIRSTQGALADAQRPVAGAPALSEALRNPKVAEIYDAVLQDAGAGKVLRYDTLAQLRSRIGGMLSSFDLVGDLPRATLKKLYGAISDDLLSGAQLMGDDAVKAATRASQYYKAGISRIDGILENTVNKQLPEQVFSLVERSGKDAITRVRAIRRSLKPEEWDFVAGTMLDRMGRGKPGQTLAEEFTDTVGQGGSFSAESFLTNWNALSAQAKDTIFGATSYKELRPDLDKIARAASAIRGSGRAFANPSGTAGALIGQGLILGGAATAASGVISLVQGEGVSGSLDPSRFLTGMIIAGVGGNVAARLLQSPGFTRWLASSTRIRPDGIGAFIGRLPAAISGESPQIREAVQEYLKSIEINLDRIAAPERPERPAFTGPTGK